MSEPKAHTRLSPTVVMILGYLALILLGAALLCMPFSSASGQLTPFADALFTATSAGCVTGLVLVDTAVYWSVFGKIVILLLIQIGGLGFITISLSMLLAFGKKIGLRQRLLMKESINAPQVGGIVRLTKFVLLVTLVAETVGAALLSIRFIPQLGVWRGIGYSVFHSVSAFCNAGFDLMGVGAPFSSFTAYSADALVVVTLSLLIVFGGLGFFVWDDLWTHRFRVKKYRLQTKIVLVCTAFLLVAGFVFLFFVERNNADFTGGTQKGRILASLFHSVTPRTAGFNTVDVNSLSEPSKAFTVIYMLIGGSPGSTAGGMKTTTLFVLLACVIATLRRRGDTELFGRRVSAETLRRATTIVVLYAVFFVASTLAVCLLENMPLLTAAFECASAIGTVGLTCGVTPFLGVASRIIIIFLMFFGRLGGLTMLYAMSGIHSTVPSRMPEEKIAVG